MERQLNPSSLPRIVDTIIFLREGKEGEYNYTISLKIFHISFVP